MKCLCNVLGYRLYLVTLLLLGSTDNLLEGNTKNHGHSLPALGYFFSNASGNSTPGTSLSLSCKYRAFIVVICFLYNSLKNEVKESLGLKN